MQDLTNLPDEWAVEITSPQDAERLQALMPKAKSFLNDSPLRLFNGNPTYRPAVIHPDPNFPQYISIEVKWIVEENGYTIYTITELEKLLNER